MKPEVLQEIANRVAQYKELTHVNITSMSCYLRGSLIYAAIKNADHLIVKDYDYFVTVNLEGRTVNLEGRTVKDRGLIYGVQTGISIDLCSQYLS